MYPRISRNNSYSYLFVLEIIVDLKDINVVALYISCGIKNFSIIDLKIYYCVYI